MEDLVQEGYTVIIRMHDDKSTSMLKVTALQYQKIGKSTINVSNIIGTPFGSMFEINGNNLIRIFEEDEEDITDVIAEESKVGGNKDFYDSNTAQKMNSTDIQELKNSGSSGTVD